ncbi:MAG: LacI family DNA-binding transcriptional regulator [Anaerolineae bacterium]|nr:LacI family DNA-binding transcriptional regulator [Anaerolineae bacterium]
MPTIYDVAREAGVSVGTVSYVINRTKRLRPETVRRVEEAMRRLSYHPHAAAKALAKGRSNVIALVHPINIYDFQMFLSTFTMAVGQVLAETDYRLAVMPLLREPKADLELEANVSARAMDGVLLLHTQLHDPRVEVLRRSGLPFVMIGRCANNRDLCFVDSDLEESARVAVRHLVELGHRSIAMVRQEGADSMATSVVHRLVTGFEAALAAEGLTTVASTPLGAPTVASLVQAVEDLLRSEPRPTAIAAANESAVMCTLKAASRLGLHVPQDLAVLGFADSPLYPLLAPPCTAVFDHAAELGRVSARMLVDILEGREPAEPQVLLPPRLIARESTVGLRSPDGRDHRADERGPGAGL